MAHNKQLDIIEINQRLTAYLNGQKDSQRSVLLSPLYTPPPRIGFAEQYEKALHHLQDIKTDVRTIHKVRSFAEWERTMPVQDKKGFVRPVFELKEFVRNQFTKEEICGFYVHGSIATQDYIPYYSDFDTVVIVKKAVLQDPAWLRDLKKRLTRSTVFLYLLDPLQHHGHFVLTEYDLASYNQILFPLELFQYTTELTDYHTPLSVRVLPSQRQNLHKEFSFWLKYFENPYDFGFTPTSSYVVKSFIQGVLFALLIYAELHHDKFYYKKFVFDAVKQDFTPRQWSLIERAEEVRTTCPFHSRYPYPLRKLLGAIHPKLLHVLHRDFDRSTARGMVSVMGPHMLDEARALTKQMEKNLIRPLTK